MNNFSGELQKIKVGLLNDSFIPQTDGVVMAVKNYAKILHEKYGGVVVAAPNFPGYKDKEDYKVIRYPSSPGGEKIGYRIGNPFSISSVRKLKAEKLGILHAHCPFSAMVLARFARKHMRVPIVLTYHTKFEIDIQKKVGLSGLKLASTKLILNNISAADEVWAVSKGAGQSLRNIGYHGPFKVMENGTDFARRRSSKYEIAALRELYGVGDDICFLFVGRMMWYKNIKFTLDALKIIHDRGVPFKMIFVGEGYDKEDIISYAKQLGILGKCVFTGLITDREKLRIHYSLADLFLFPSLYDTNGLVVREASACDLGSVVIRDSCAAESVPNEQSAILIDDNLESYAEAIYQAAMKKDSLAALGRNAGDNIYLSWDDAVARAYVRYGEILG
ncbi:MAG: glycosyltransferase, partial [Bacillota bacterium]|nr:glycosyltransferase [Bacillota bacterium]